MIFFTSRDLQEAILIIEEVRTLVSRCLSKYALLTNLETSQRKLLQIIMLGQPELKRNFVKTSAGQLSQRITAQYHLGPLGKHEITSYVKHRLAVAGLVRGELFPPPVIKMLYSLTGGIPRIINVICDRALLLVLTQRGNQL